MVFGRDSSENQKSHAIPVATPSREAGPKSVHPLCSSRLTPPPLCRIPPQLMRKAPARVRVGGRSLNSVERRRRGWEELSQRGEGGRGDEGKGEGQCTLSLSIIRREDGWFSATAVPTPRLAVGRRQSARVCGGGAPSPPAPAWTSV